MEISLLDVFESQTAGVLDLLRLAGLDPARRHADLSLGRGAELHVVAAAAFAGLREHPLNERLDAVWDLLEGRGWVLFEAPEQEPWRRWGPLLRPPTGMPREVAIDVAAEALRVTFLWSATRALTAHWHGCGGAVPPGICDLHRRPDASGRAPSLETEAPEAVLAVIDSAAPAIERATAVLDLLPRLRSRLALVLAFALELPGDEVVSVLCESCPEGAEVDARKTPALAAQSQALASLRVQQERARQAIEDGLNQGDERLMELLTRARTTPLPDALAAAVSSAQPGRASRRVEAAARLLWLMTGPSADPSLLDDDPVALARTLIDAPLEPPAEFAPLLAAGEADDVAMFLLRYAVHRHAHERPGRETLATLLPDAPPGRAAGRAVAARLAESRRRVIRGLEGDRPGVGRRRLQPEVQWSAARSPAAARLAFREGLRTEVGEGMLAGAPPKLELLRGRTWRRWLPEGLSFGALTFRPVPALGHGRGDRVQIHLPPEARAARPILVREGPDGPELLLPTAGGAWPHGSELGESLTVELSDRPGEHRYLLLLPNQPMEPSLDELQRALARQDITAWEVRVDVS